MIVPHDIEKNRLKQLIHTGAPPELRGEVWWATSGGRQKAEKEGDERSYALMFSQSQAKECEGSAVERQVTIAVNLLSNDFTIALERLSNGIGSICIRFAHVFRSRLESLCNLL
jgi:hypothetical protein